MLEEFPLSSKSKKEHFKSFTRVKQAKDIDWRQPERRVQEWLLSTCITLQSRLHPI